MKKIRFLWLVLPATIILGNSPLSADTLHGFCYGATPACSDNGTVTPTSTNPPNFGFTISPGPQTGDYRIDVLVPNNEVASTFAITGTQGGVTNTSPIVGSATLFSATAWTSGQLDAYLGISASPTNPIGAFLPCSQNPASCGVTGTADPGATGYFVYQADLGQNRLQGNSSALSGPLLNITGLPLNSLIVGFLNEGTVGAPNWGATANSGAIFESKAPPVAPEPASVLTLGSGLVGLSLLVRRLRKSA
jgi:hypothetical protein